MRERACVSRDYGTAVSRPPAPDVTRRKGNRVVVLNHGALTEEY